MLDDGGRVPARLLCCKEVACVEVAVLKLKLPEEFDSEFEQGFFWKETTLGSAQASQLSG